MEIRKQYEMEVFDVSTDGEGIGRIDGMVTFVPGLVPGDRATVEIVKQKKKTATGRVVSLDVPSADRVEPLCPQFSRCGGCTLQNLKYDAQLRLKEKQIRDRLERIFGGDFPEMEPIVGMQEPWRYRNKASYAVSAGRALIQEDGSVRNDGPVRVGFHDAHGRKITDCPDCLIQAPPAVAAAQALRQYLAETGVSVYDERNRKGKIRQLVVRTGFESGEVMVTVVTNGKKLPDLQLLGDLMYDAIDALNAEDEGASEPDRPFYELRSLVINHNSNRSLAEVSTKADIIYGSRVIRDSASGLVFEISPFSFYQVNPPQMKRLYDTVLEFADLQGTELVFDLYCGVGTIGLYCAQKAGYVWGIEDVRDAVIDANRNAVINGLVNIRFLQGRAEDKIQELVERAGKPDLVILDPPRAGCKPELLEAVLQAGPENIIYVSCDPGSLARDLKILTQDASYRIRRIRPVDQFCHSVHVETVVLLSHKTPDSHIHVKVEFGEG